MEALEHVDSEFIVAPRNMDGTVFSHGEVKLSVGRFSDGKVSVELSQAGEFGMRFVLGSQEAERLREVLNDT